MPSQWPAVGAETDLLRRARQLQRSWERLLADGALGRELPPGATAGLRPTIVESWQRSLATGLDPTDLLAPIEADESEVLDRWFEHPLGSLTHVLTEQLRKVAEESRSVVVVTDASGLVLYTMGDERLKERAAEQNHLVEGARWSEAADGTNGIGTALAADHAFQVFGFEHFNARHHEWICSGAPVHDPVSGQMIGLIDLSNLWKVAHPRSLELVTTAARTIEQCLVDARRDRDARLRRRYSDLMTRSTDLLVDRDGYVLDGAELAHSSPFDIPEGGGEVVLGDGSVAVAAPLGQGEAYLVRQGTTRHARSAPTAKGPERAEERARELATEQAALRQVATLVARESSPDQLFAVVAEQVALVFDVPLVRLVRYEPDGSVVVGGFSEGDHEPFPIGSRWPLDGPGVIATVRQTGRSARVEDYAHVTGEIAAVVRGAGMRSAVATPIVVERHLWGAMVVLSPRHEPFPEDTEAQLTDFTELVATAIASAESRVAIGRLVDEQAALRRVATLVARGTEPATVFRAVCNEAQALLGADRSGILRFHHDRTVTVMATSGGPGQHRVGTRVSFDPGFLVDRVHETHQAARFDTDDPAAADMPEIVRMLGVRSAVGSPIVVDGELWGVITLASVDRSLPLGMERRLADFTELVATAIANAESRVAVARLADEQAALRRVATLVAQDAPPAEIFSAVSAEVDRVFGLDPATFDVAVVGRFEPGPELVIVGISKSVDVGPLGSRWPLDDLYAPTHVLRTGRSARIRVDDVVSAGGEVAEFLRHSGYLSQVASPIVVDGRLWGAMLVTTRSDLPPDTEERLEQFTELVATAIANTESREALAQLAEEQAALRSVATLVAENVPSGELCAAVTQEAGTLLGTDYAGMIRYEDDATVTALASWAATGELPPIPDRFRTEPGDPTTMVAETRQPARVDDWTVVPGPLAAFLRDELAVRSSVGSPIVVEGRLWGVLGVHSKGHVPLPPDTESRIEQFTELVATAIANREARTEVERLADEQAALRRVATLVARDAPRDEVFTGIASEIGHLFSLEEIRMVRYQEDGTGVVVARSGPSEDFFPLGSRVSVDADTAASRVLRTGEPVRMDYGTATGAIAEAVRSMGIHGVVAAPISVEGRVWGAIAAGTTKDEPLPPATESRLGQFTELMATAVANTESRAEVERLADEQAALRRVATLVAEGSSPSAVLDAVAAEMERALGAEAVMLSRYEPDEEVTVVARRVPDPRGLPLGTRVSHQGENVTSMVRRTGRPARIGDYERARGPIADLARAVERNVRSAVGAPIVVDGRLWGVIVASWGGERSPPGETEERMAKFAQLLDTAIANADSRDQLTASRARLLTAGDEARRRVVRDLHDGAQQRLVHTIVTLKLAQRAFRDEDGKAESLLGEALDHAEQGNRELRELAHGILPAVLTRGGLRAGVDAFVARLDLPVAIDVPAERLPAELEASAYFIVAEGLTNVTKHSHATRAEVKASVDDGLLQVEVRDDGIGGADPSGHGLVGMADRVSALGGSLSVQSPAGGGTLVTATLPLHAH